ncbi:MAG TPA: DNRLRE domain-containing protein [Thermoanaerobaculia bacterium]|nr:DNRLRE domain-containing protein [Thermoanaerobaculia bacterium]
MAALPLAAVPVPAAAQAPPEVGIQVRQDVSPPLRDIPPVIVTKPGPPREIPNKRYDRPARPPAPGGDPLLGPSQAFGPSTQSTPAPIRNLEGMSADDNFALLAMRFAPADPVGDVGPTHYVQAVNLLLSVHLKSTGARIYGPVALKTLWSGFGGLCESQNDGDPIVLYDDAADRWLISQLAIDSSWSGHQCIAVSTTGNPTGSYHRYDFAMTSAYLNDYPKIGVWPDGYYMSVNEFDDLGYFYGVTVVAFERARMLTGASAQMVTFHPYPCGPFNPPVPECPFGLQPAHWEGGTPPPGGTPNPFLMAWDDEVNGTGANPDGYRLYDFAVNWTSPASSTFTARPHVASPEFDRQIATVPEPAPGEALDALADYTMYRLQYRSFGGHEALVTNHTVDVNGADLAGIRWAELRRSGGGGWTLHQTGTHAPADGLHRWNGSIAMDGFGHIALGYNVASSSKHASVRYVSRAAADPLGTLPGGEIELVSGSGVQQNSSNRWGDYAALSVDPVDDCTFWLTQEYLTDSGQYDWKTRIGAFDLCGPGCSPTETPETSCADGLDNDCDGLTDAADPDCGPPPPTTSTFTSAAADDGYVLESGENTNVGGSNKSNDSGTSALRAGDNQQDRQYRSILSFDTAPIPDGAAMQAATLRVRRGSLTGTNPFTTHGSLTADVRTGGFNGNAALENADFQAAATATAVCTLSNAPANGDWSECTLNAAGLAAVNKAGKTQVRIRFTSDDNDDNGNDYLGWYSGDNGTAANRPQLVVTYQ